MATKTASPVISTEKEFDVAKLVLYSLIGAIALVIVIIVIVIICLCTKRKKQKEIKEPAMEMKILDEEAEEEAEDTTILCGGASKKRKKRNAPSPLPSAPPYEPGTMIGGVYERISSADIELQYDVTFLGPSNDKVDKESTYVTIGRSNSFNPGRDRPVRRSRETAQDSSDGSKKVKRNESIKLIETGIAPSQTEDFKSRVQDITRPHPNGRIKQKRTSKKTDKTYGSPVTNLRTHEDVKISPQVPKKDLNKVPRLTDSPEPQKLLNTRTGKSGKPASISGASVVSSNEGSVSEVTSNLGTDSGYEDINSENSPTVKRNGVKTSDETCTNSTNSSPLARRNYIEVEIVGESKNPKLVDQKTSTIDEQKEGNEVEARHDNLVQSETSNYTEVVIGPITS